VRYFLVQVTREPVHSRMTSLACARCQAYHIAELRQRRQCCCCRCYYCCCVYCDRKVDISVTMLLLGMCKSTKSLFLLLVTASLLFTASSNAGDEVSRRLVSKVMLADI